jgi:hypothetical protein
MQSIAYTHSICKANAGVVTSIPVVLVTFVCLNSCTAPILISYSGVSDESATATVQPLHLNGRYTILHIARTFCI